MALVLPPYSRGAGLTTGPGQGTNTFAPGSIDSTFEYNGLLLNYRKWWDTYLITSVSGMDGIDIRDNREDRPEQHGEFAYENFYSGRTIVLTGKIRAFSYDKMRDMAQALRQAFASMEELPLTIKSPRTTTEVTIPCRLTAKIDMLEEQKNYLFERDFQISLRASYPFFSSVDEKAIVPVAPASESEAGNYGRTISNAGNAPAPLRIKFTGPVAMGAIVALGDNDYVQLNKALPFNHTLEIDSRNSSVVNELGEKDFVTYNVLSDWLYGPPGETFVYIGIYGHTTSTRVEIFWRDTWI